MSRTDSRLPHAREVLGGERGPLGGPGRSTAPVLVLLAAAVVFGGGGSPWPAPELLVQVVACLCAAAWLVLSDAVRHVPRAAWLLAAMIVVLPAVQLIPLPPGLWRALPGRAVEASALALVGGGGAWMPVSVSPPRTLAALLAQFPAVFLVVAVAAQSRHERKRTVAAIAVLAVLTAIVGAVQLAGGETSWLRIYGSAHAGYLTGFQANRNAAADVLLLGILAVAASFAVHRRGWGRDAGVASQDAVIVAACGAVLLLGTAVLLTGSRAGMALALPAVALVVLIVRPAWPRPSGRGVRKPAIAAAVAASVLAIAVTGAAAFTRMFERFATGGEPRPALWADTIYAIEQYWPIGSGLGTFVPVFTALEPLEAVDTSLPNRAHNDVLELALEGGAAGLILLFGIAALLAAQGWRCWRDSPEMRPLVVFAGGGLGLVAVHSLVDYPLRSMALACLAGACAGLLMSARDAGGHTQIEGLRRE